MFRQEDFQAGDRVTLRAEVGGQLTEFIGFITELEPLTISRQTTAEEIRPEKVIAMRKMSPVRVRNSEIRDIERAYAQAFPGMDQRWSSDNQWLMRAGDGITERSNSATPLGASAGLTAIPLEEMEAFYAEHNMPVRLHVPERLVKNVEKFVADNNWELTPEILVMTKDLDAQPVSIPEGYSFRMDVGPDQDWLDRYHFRGQQLPAAALRQLSGEIEGTLGFARLVDKQNRTVAITRATVTSGWLGYSAVEVDPAYRRLGLGTALTQAVLGWGAENGAAHAYLQVISTNVAGIGLYRSLGFAEHHRHRYATKR